MLHEKLSCDFCATSIKFHAISTQFYKMLITCNLLIYNCIVFYPILWYFVLGIPASSTEINANYLKISGWRFSFSVLCDYYATSFRLHFLCEKKAAVTLDKLPLVAIKNTVTAFDANIANNLID